MSDHVERHPLTLKTVRYAVAGVDAVVVRKDVSYKAGDDSLRLDVYCPPAAAAAEPAPAVIIVLGYPDVDVPNPFGCHFKEFGMAASWARLVAASGMIAVTYTTREPAADIRSVIEHVRQHADSLSVNPHRIGLLASSANVAVALSALMADHGLSCAAFLCGFLLDLDGSTVVSQAAKAYGFVDACAGRSVEDVRADVPLFLARAGKDQFAGLNDVIDAFVAKALDRNLPITCVNYANGAHAFDLDDDSRESRDMIRQIVAFLSFHLHAGARP